MKAFRNCDRYSSQFLLAIPNSIGFIEDHLFSEIFAQYLGLPSPACAPIVGGFIGSSRPLRVDRYGNALAACTSVPGDGFRHAHDTYKRALNDVFRVAGLRTAMEVRNLFQGRVAAELHDEYIDKFIRMNYRNGIIPDILIYNYPASADDVKTMFTASARTKEAIFEVKGLRITENNYSLQGERAVDVRARRIPKEYADKAKHIDEAIAPTAEPVGPFSQVLRRFVTGGPIPVVIGGFAETNKEFDAIISMASQLAARTHAGRHMIPSSSATTDESASLMRDIFRRSLGVMFAKANASLKLERLHLVGSTAAEAESLARQHRSERRWTPDATDCPSWFTSNYGNPNYKAWFEFRNSRNQFNARNHGTFGIRF
jgi:hypothetical protein